LKAYLVGGAVRDALLGLPVEERDWVLVGADALELERRGYRRADAEFPVFTHPQTGDEYALARRETKRGPGYRGFAIDAGPDVTLEEDLRRRDLTINAIARTEDGELIDPFGGREDLAAGVLRHVSPAFVEDPLRVLRTARFAAKLGAYGFRIAHGTHRLMCDMVGSGAMRELAPERFGRETLKAMSTLQPWRYLEVLHRCGALQELLPLVDACMGEVAPHGTDDDGPAMSALKRSVSMTDDPEQRLVATLWPCVNGPADMDSAVAALRLGRPAAQLLRRSRAVAPHCEAACRLDHEALVELAVQWHNRDAVQRTGLINVCAAQSENPQLTNLLTTAIRAAAEIDARALLDRGLAGPELGAALDRQRRQSAAQALAAAAR
jgi:tRNA nucleotidyltransferase (CCA-adding enzyme)